MIRVSEGTNIAEVLLATDGIGAGDVPIRLAEVVRKDLAEELVFLGCFDRSYKGVRAVVDMPNREEALFVRLALRNGGRLPKTRRKLFEEVTDAEIAAMEAAVQLAQAPIERDGAETDPPSRRGSIRERGARMIDRRAAAARTRPMLSCCNGVRSAAHESTARKKRREGFPSRLSLPRRRIVER